LLGATAGVSCHLQEMNPAAPRSKQSTNELYIVLRNRDRLEAARLMPLERNLLLTGKHQGVTQIEGLGRRRIRYSPVSV
jgi:hypothetical protein